MRPSWKFGQCLSLIPCTHARSLFPPIVDTVPTSCLSSILLLSSSTEFIRELNVLYRGLEQAKQGQRCDGDLRQVDMVKLREAMDTCLDKLPTLLNIELRESDSIGDVVPRVLSQLRALSLYSETGSVTTSDERTSESVAYTLQKVQFNSQSSDPLIVTTSG